ncbi:MAG: hypothetical protein KF819_38630 [Labilithrix sp.]|nr:hypothetical protein [Labilithrix sp.]
MGSESEVERALRVEKQERAEAEERAKRANERAKEADEAYRRLQLDLVAAKDEALAARQDAQKALERVKELEAAVETLKDLAAAARKKTTSTPPAKSAGAPAHAEVEQMLSRIADLREMLANASNDLSQLHADEVVLSKKRARTLADVCAILARAVGATRGAQALEGAAPPPLPSAALEARLSVAPVVDISEVADLIESLRPPKAPDV